MIPIYLIVPRNYEYDDEYYNPAGYEEPSQGFLSRDKAEKALKALGTLPVLVNSRRRGWEGSPRIPKNSS